jgi:hypothetical protein
MAGSAAAVMCCVRAQHMGVAVAAAAMGVEL